jgi:sarcosine oxidase subunit gamma
MPDRAKDGAGVEATGLLHLTVLNGHRILKLKSWFREFADGTRRVILAGRELPVHVGETLVGSQRLLAIGPGEWLLIVPEMAYATFLEQIKNELDELGVVWVDLSDSLVRIELRGPAARDVLSKGCGLDMHPGQFPAGRCAATRCAGIPMIIEPVIDSGCFILTLARSYLRYAQSWLRDAAVEFYT